MSGTDWLLIAVLLFAAAALVFLVRRNAAEGVAALDEVVIKPIDTENGASKPSALALVEPVELMLGTSAHEPVLSVSAFDFSVVPSNARHVDIQKSNISSLSALLQGVPSLLTAAEFGSGQYMKVIVNGDLASAAGGINLLPFVRGADGRVVEVALLQAPSLLGSLINGAVVWQIASMVVAQKHLADISRKLDEIKQAIGKVREFQLDERRTKVTGAIGYLEQVIGSIRAGEFSPAVRTNLESNEMALLGVQQHLEIDLKALIHATQSIKEKDTFGTKELFDDLVCHNAGLASHIELWSLCTKARFINWLALAPYPDEPILKKNRLAAIRKSIDQLLESDEVRNELRASWEGKIQKIKSRIQRESTLEERRVRLKIEGANTQLLLSESASHSLENLQHGDSLLARLGKPLTFAVKIDQNRIIEAWELAENDSLAPSSTVI